MVPLTCVANQICKLLVSYFILIKQQWEIIAESIQEVQPEIQHKIVLRHEKNANEKLESENQSVNEQ
jgi:hypothetical protein